MTPASDLAQDDTDESVGLRVGPNDADHLRSLLVAARREADSERDDQLLILKSGSPRENSQILRFAK